MMRADTTGGQETHWGETEAAPTLQETTAFCGFRVCLDKDLRESGTLFEECSGEDVDLSYFKTRYLTEFFREELLQQVKRVRMVSVEEFYSITKLKSRIIDS